MAATPKQRTANRANAKKGGQARAQRSTKGGTTRRAMPSSANTGSTTGGLGMPKGEQRSLQAHYNALTQQTERLKKNFPWLDGNTGQGNTPT